MDLISPDKRQATFDQRAQEVRQKCAAAGWDTVRVFPTSIWDETLYSVCSAPKKTEEDQNRYLAY